jgi:hypothetical protein
MSYKQIFGKIFITILISGISSFVYAQQDVHKNTVTEVNGEDLMLLFLTGKNPSSFNEVQKPSDYLRTQSTEQATRSSSAFQQALTTKPGYAFLGSAIVPGLSQAANKQYWKTAVYLAAEAATIYLVIDGNKRGERLERDYINIGNQDWSVMKYAAWVHNYYHNVPGARSPGAPNINITSLLTPAGLEEYNRQGGFPMPQYDTDTEWKWINIQALRQLERSSLYLTSGRPFSHDLPDLGSQQYYELMSKYYQFAPGWRDWNDNNHNVNAGISGMSPMWIQHAHLEERFNDSYRFAGNMLTLMVVNHVISAFDAYFTIKLKNHKLESGMVYQPGFISYQLTYKF